MWDPSSGRSLRTLTGHTNYVRALAVLPNGWLASGSSDNTVRVWDVNTGSCMRTYAGHTGNVRGLTVLSDGRLLSAAWDETARVWDVQSGNTDAVRILKRTGEAFISAASLPNGHVAVGGRKDITIYDPANDVIVRTITGHTSFVNAITLLPSGAIASTSDDQSARVFNPYTGEQYAELSGHTSWVWPVANVTGGRIATGAGDRTFKLWDISRLASASSAGFAAAAAPSFASVPPAFAGAAASPGSDFLQTAALQARVLALETELATVKSSVVIATGRLEREMARIEALESELRRTRAEVFEREQELVQLR